MEPDPEDVFKTSDPSQWTFVLIKPDGLARGLVGEVFNRFEQAGLTIAAADVVKPSKTVAAKHYGPEIADTYGNWVRESLISYFSSDTVMPIVFHGRNAVTTGRKIVGQSFDPTECAGHTIRGQYSSYDAAAAEREQVPIPNIVHAADSTAAAAKETALWFPNTEFQTYERPDVEMVARRFGGER